MPLEQVATRPKPPMARIAAVFAGLLGACAAYGPAALPPGMPEADARRALGRPSAEFAGQEGRRRLEYAGGAFGRQTYMLDFDGQGRLLRAENVLTESHFATVQPGWTADQLRRALGPPARRWAVRYHDQTVWSYRFDTPFCQLFHVGITPEGRVEDTSYGPDPLCDDDDRSIRRR